MEVRLEFVHALVDRQAARAGVRVLHIKGVAAGRQLGLRGRRPADVDVLVAPGDEAALVAALEGCGWTREDPTRAARLVGHATVLTHPGWGCAVDLHHRFPGIELDATTAFDLLWQERVALVLGGHIVHVPPGPAQALLVLLHAARGHGTPRARDDVEQVRCGLGPDEAGDVRRWAQRLHSGAALRAVAADWGRSGGRLHDWHWRAQADPSGSGVQLWIGRALTAPSVRTAAAVLATAVVPDRRTMSIRAGRPLSRGALVAAWVGRWGTGLAAFVRSIRSRAGADAGPPPGLTVPDRGSAPGAGGAAPTGPGELVEDDDLALRLDGDRAWVARLSSARVHVLTEPALLVWERARVHGRAPEAEILARVVADLRPWTALPGAELTGQVRDTLAQLRAAGLLGSG